MTSASTSTAPATSDDGGGLLTHRQIMTILSGLLLGMFLAALDQTVVATAIRTIADDLDGYSLQAWATTAFLVTSTLSTPLYGKLGDQFGRKGLFTVAITIFVAGSALCGLAQSMYELAGFRAVQGLGAGGLMSLALSIIADIVPPLQRARYQGYMMAVFGVSSVIGPVVGGFFAGIDSLVGIAGWRYIFWINVPVGAAALVVVAKQLHLPKVGARDRGRLDIGGAIALAVGLTPLLIIAEQGREWGWGSGRAFACYVVGAVGTAAFLAIERAMGQDALLPLRMFRSRTYSVGSTSSFLSGMAMFGGLALVPQYLQVVKGSSPTSAGLQMVTLMVGIMAAVTVSGRVIPRTGRYKLFPVVGAGLMALAMFSMGFVDADTSRWYVLPLLTAFGFGLGFTMQPVVLAVQNASDPRDIGVATSSVTFFRQMGGTLGTAIFLSVLFTNLKSDIASRVGDAQGTAVFQQAVAAHPDQAASLQGGGDALKDTSFIAKLDGVIAHPFKQGFADSIDVVFFAVAGVLAAAFLVTLLLPELPLRTKSAMQVRHEREAEASSAAGHAAAVATATAADAAPTFAPPGVLEQDEAGSADREPPGAPA